MVAVARLDGADPTPAEGPDRSRARQQLHVAALVCAALAGVLALVGLAGWVFDAPILTRLHHGYTTMKIDTSVMLVLLAVAVWLDGRDGLTRRIGLGCAAVAGLIAVEVLIEYAIGYGSGIDQAFGDDPGGGPHPGRPSAAAGLGVLLLALTFARRPEGRARRHVSQVLSLIVLSFGGLAVLGYAYGVASLYSLRLFSTIALHTALAMMLLSLARLLTIRRGVAEWVHAGVKPGATLMQIVVPAATLGLPLVGYACVVLRRHGVINGDAVVATIVLLSVLALIAASWASAVKLDRVDRRRRRALADLHALADDLERQVVERSEQVQQGRDELVLLADRQRIAADLHDVVVQRLFAAGMTLNSVDPAGVAEGVGGRIDEAVEAMDAAIRDLRASIFELSRPVAAAADLLTTLDGICIEAARVLGFEPDLTVDDPDDEAEPFRADILAVVRESLANVARHARAASAVVTLRSGDGSVTLSIADDGVGMTKAPHSSGTRNMQERAQRRDGTCTWSPAHPHGTVVVWQVPSRTAAARDAGAAPDTARAGGERAAAASARR